MNERPDRWAAPRAAFALAHIVAISLLGLPEPKVSPTDLKEPEIQAWFDNAHARLNALGVSVSREAVEAWGVDAGRRWLDVKETALAPARQYAMLVGAHQSWRMFGDVPQKSAILFIEAQVDDTWRVIHRTRYTEVAWRPGWFNQERMRALVNQFTRKRNRSDYDRLARYIGPRVAADFPDATKLRMGMQEVRFTVPTPGESAVGFFGRFWVRDLPRTADELAAEVERVREQRAKDAANRERQATEAAEAAAAEAAQ